MSLDAGGGQEEMDWTNESVTGRITEKRSDLKDVQQRWARK